MRFKVAIKILWLDSAESSIVAFKKVESLLQILRFAWNLAICGVMQIYGIAWNRYNYRHCEAF